MRKDHHPIEFHTLVTLVESTTAGVWASHPDRCWASRLATLISDVQSHPVTLHNVGIGANVVSTASPGYPHSGKPAANERLDKHVFAHRPDLLIISYGLNDARGGTPLDLFARELSALIAAVHARIDPLIVLPGPYYMTDFAVDQPNWAHANIELFHHYNDRIGAIAHDKYCLYVDLLAAYNGTPWMVHHDGVHANDLGHLIVANKIFEVLAQHCSGLALHTRALEQRAPRWRDESVLRADYGHYSQGHPHGYTHPRSAHRPLREDGLRHVYPLRPEPGQD